MKVISRTIKMYCYTYARIDIETCKAVDIETITQPFPMTRLKEKEIKKRFPSHVRISVEETEMTYAMPIDLFVETCERYAAEHGETEDSEADDSEEEN